MPCTEWNKLSCEKGWAERAARQLGPVYSFLFNKWYFDELYQLLFVRPAFWFGRLFWKSGDEGIIDRFGPNGLPLLQTLTHPGTSSGSKASW